MPMVPVVLDGQELFAVRGVSAYPAHERAAAVLERPDCSDHALKTLERLWSEAFVPGRGMPHRLAAGSGQQEEQGHLAQGHPANVKRRRRPLAGSSWMTSVPVTSDGRTVMRVEGSSTSDLLETISEPLAERGLACRCIASQADCWGIC